VPIWYRELTVYLAAKIAGPGHLRCICSS
jgi:hypothetical protein